MKTSAQTNTASPADARSNPAPQEERTRQRARARTVRQSIFRRSLVGLTIVSGIVLTPLTTRWPETGLLLRDVILILGTLLICAGASLRLWAGLYIGGNKERQLVREGPYSCVRNPLYLGNLLAATGITALTGSPLVTALTLTSTTAVYLMTIAQEEKKLLPLFGSGYATYLREVPSLLPRIFCVRCLIHDSRPATITHRSLARELVRCLGFAALGLVAFLLTTAAPSMRTLLAGLH